MKPGLQLCAILAVATLWCSSATAQEPPSAPPAPSVETGVDRPASPDTAPRTTPGSPTPEPPLDAASDSPAEIATEGAPPQAETEILQGEAPETEGNLTTEAIRPEAEADDETLGATAIDASERALQFLRDGGPAIWAIAVLSVVTVALILWKIWRLALTGAWSRGKAGRAVELFLAGDAAAALALVEGRRGIRSQVMSTALKSIENLPKEAAREETARVAKRHLATARDGLGALELIATIAPLLGLLGTVLGMIAAFQALQAAGSRADPALLAGGIWEALLTTAAGMAVAIPASAALTWFDSVIERMRRDIEDNAVRVFIAASPAGMKLAAE
ncbi:MotA/TolQ/ExbB proton channel family protein [Cribrihabitans sp. XS_ASV171]